MHLRHRMRELRGRRRLDFQGIGVRLNSLVGRGRGIKVAVGPSVRVGAGSGYDASQQEAFGIMAARAAYRRGLKTR